MIKLYTKLNIKLFIKMTLPFLAYYSIFLLATIVSMFETSGENNLPSTFMGIGNIVLLISAFLSSVFVIGIMKEILGNFIFIRKKYVVSVIITSFLMSGVIASFYCISYFTLNRVLEGMIKRFIYSYCIILSLSLLFMMIYMAIQIYREKTLSIIIDLIIFGILFYVIDLLDPIINMVKNVEPTAVNLLYCLSIFISVPLMLLLGKKLQVGGSNHE